MTEYRVGYICADCGSENIHICTASTWDVAQQEWVIVLDLIEDMNWCRNCEEEVKFEEIEIEEAK